MGKRKISAREAMDDIRSGMSDDALMKKYRLSEQGLASLIKKLCKRGLLKQLNAKEALKDIRSGMDDEQLMEKYRVSAKGLQTMLEQMVHAGLLSQDLRDTWRLNVERKAALARTLTANDLPERLGEGIVAIHDSGEPEPSFFRNLKGGLLKFLGTPETPEHAEAREMPELPTVSITIRLNHALLLLAEDRARTDPAMPEGVERDALVSYLLWKYAGCPNEERIRAAAEDAESIDWELV